MIQFDAIFGVLEEVTKKLLRSLYFDQNCSTLHYTTIIMMGSGLFSNVRIIKPAPFDAPFDYMSETKPR